MKKILYLSYFYDPDISAGSFRNTSLSKELARQCLDFAEIDVFTTMPNRYLSFEASAPKYSSKDNLHVVRISVPREKNGMLDQVKSFRCFYKEVKKRIRDKKYDLVFASSSKLFTSYLGYCIAKQQDIPLILDIRDIFVDTLKDVLKNKLLKFFLLPSLRVVERRTFNYASHINLISKGFSEYFSKFKCKSYSFFPNGIDEIFLEHIGGMNAKENELQTITYAGNIGEGQGLHKIIPRAAKLLGSNYLFRIIGDGGAKDLLVLELDRLKVSNVLLENPVKRDELISIYENSDYLFIHLNDYQAFEKVLPSKIFELGTFNKPIIAGLSGYSKKFILENLTNVIVFNPGDINSLVNKLRTNKYRLEYRNDFIKKYRRSNIDTSFSKVILESLCK